MGHLRRRLRRRVRRRPPRYTKPVLATVSPERLVRCVERRCGASARDPDAFDRVASPQPGCDLVLSLNNAGVRLVIGRVWWRVVRARLLRHRRGYRFWRPKVFSAVPFFSPSPRRREPESNAARWILSNPAETQRESAVLLGARRSRLAPDRGELRPIAVTNFFSTLVLPSSGLFETFARACNEEPSLSRARCGIV